MKKIVFIFVILLFTYFKTESNATASTVKNNGALVFGKFKIGRNKPLLMEKTTLYFNERLWGKYAVRIDENGYFNLKLPIGTNFISMINYNQGSGFNKNLADNYATINITSMDSVYYIGDINIDWVPMPKDEKKYSGGGAMGGTIEAIKESKENLEQIPITVLATENTIEHFKQKYPESKFEIVTQLLTVNK